LACTPIGKGKAKVEVVESFIAELSLALAAHTGPGTAGCVTFQWMGERNNLNQLDRAFQRCLFVFKIQYLKPNRRGAL